MCFFNHFCVCLIDTSNLTVIHRHERRGCYPSHMLPGGHIDIMTVSRSIFILIAVQGKHTVFYRLNEGKQLYTLQDDQKEKKISIQVLFILFLFLRMNERFLMLSSSARCAGGQSASFTYSSPERKIIYYNKQAINKKSIRVSQMCCVQKR